MRQPPNMQQMMKQVQKMQEDMLEAQEALKHEEVEASAGGGMVKVKVSGDLVVKSITISPEAVDPDDAELGLLELLGGAQALVHGRQDHVLKQLGVVGVDRLGADRDRLDDEVAGDLHGDHAAARRGLDLLVLERLLRLHHVLLHLLDPVSYTHLTLPTNSRV